MDLSVKSIIELKSMGYDQLAVMENAQRILGDAQRNLKLINQELTNRQQLKSVEESVEEQVEVPVEESAQNQDEAGS